jgi:hypothetical protein
MKVWRHKNTAYIPRNIQPTVPYGGGSVMVWRCISHDCKLDLVTGVNPTCLDDASTLRPVVIAAAIPDAMLVLEIILSVIS